MTKIYIYNRRRGSSRTASDCNSEPCDAVCHLVLTFYDCGGHTTITAFLPFAQGPRENKWKIKKERIKENVHHTWYHIPGTWYCIHQMLQGTPQIYCCSSTSSMYSLHDTCTKNETTKEHRASPHKILDQQTDHTITYDKPTAVPCCTWY